VPHRGRKEEIAIEQTRKHDLSATTSFPTSLPFTIMAREKKQRRGRRGTKKVKPSVEEAGRPVEDEDHSDDEQVEEPDVEAEVDAAPGPVEPASLPGQPFYGLVPTDTRQYAMNVETMLEEQSFEDAEGGSNIWNNSNCLSLM